MIFATLLAAISQVLLKLSANQSHKNIVKEYLNWRVVAGYGLLALSMLINIVAYRGVKYQTGTILGVLSYIYVVIFGRMIFKERITIKKVLGTGLIVAGMVIFTM